MESYSLVTVGFFPVTVKKVRRMGNISNEVSGMLGALDGEMLVHVPGFSAQNLHHNEARTISRMPEPTTATSVHFSFFLHGILVVKTYLGMICLLVAYSASRRQRSKSMEVALDMK